MTGPMDGKKAKVFTSAFETYTSVKPPIGYGGCGTVFEVTDSDGVKLALKVVDGSRISRQKLKRFRNEIQFCLHPRSNHIVRILDYGKGEGGQLFCVMPYYPSTLRKQIKAGIPPGEVLRLYSQILDSVEAAHLLGACHRDIKPENILYDVEANRLVLADFGIARFKEDDLLTIVDTSADERLGSFAYAAPEQRFAGKEVDHRADIYALGLLLNEMYTGHIPQGTGFRTIKDIFPEHEYLDGLVDKMIQQQPEQRPASVRHIKEELIWRGIQFVNSQHLDRLKNEVVPDTEINDPLVIEPIRPVGIEDYSNNTLIVRLSKEVNPKWEACFRRRATRYSTHMSSAMIRFQRNTAQITAAERFVQDGVDFLKEYCEAANEEYANQIRREHVEELSRKVGALKARRVEAERKKRILEQVRI